MDKHEARTILARRIAELRQLPYDSLKSTWLGQADSEGVVGVSGALYQLEIQVFWDDLHEVEGNLRVSVAIDDGGLRALAPLSDGFIVAPDGSFVGE